MHIDEKKHSSVHFTMGACSSKENSYTERGDGKSIWTKFINTKKNRHRFVFPSISQNDWYYSEYIRFYGYMRENALYAISNDIIALILYYYDSRYTAHFSKNIQVYRKTLKKFQKNRLFQKKKIGFGRN